MAIHVAVNHVTTYRYDRLVELSPQLVRLRPAPHCRTPILSYSLRATPGKHFVNWQQDPQSNYVARIAFPEKVHELRIEVDLVVEMAVYDPFDFFGWEWVFPLCDFPAGNHGPSDVQSFHRRLIPMQKESQGGIGKPLRRGMHGVAGLGFQSVGK